MVQYRPDRDFIEVLGKAREVGVHTTDQVRDGRVVDPMTEGVTE